MKTVKKALFCLLLFGCMVGVSLSFAEVIPEFEPVWENEKAADFLEKTITVANSGSNMVEMKTSSGTIKIELYREKAPISVDNFLQYADSGFYDGTIFHRVIDKFMIQGGGFAKNLKRKPTAAPIKNEATNGLKNKRGTVAIARTSVVDSGTSQFFINLVDNDFLNNRGTAVQTYGYAVFGKVVEGMDVVDKIAQIPTKRKNKLFQNLPEPLVIIESIKRVADQ